VGSTLIIVLVSTVVPIAFMVFIFAKVFGGITKRTQDTERLMATGMPAQGRVLGISTTGTSLTVMGHRHLDLVLQMEVQLPGRPPYMAQFNQLVSELRVPSLQPGAMVQLRVDPTNPMHMVVADGAPAGGAAQWPGAAAPAAGFGAMGPPAPGFGGMSPPPAPGFGGMSPPPAPGFGGMSPAPAAGFGGMGPAPGMMGAMPGAGFGAPDMGGALKKSWRFSIIMMVVTTVPVLVILLAVFVDWSALFGGDGAPKGGWCKGAARCCQVVHGGAAECEQWKNFPGSGCKDVYDGYERAAKAMGKTCK
jgi:hypothetical protein